METITLPPTQNFKSLLEKFCKDCKLRGLTKQTTIRYKSNIKRYANYFNHTNLISLKTQMLEKYLSYLKFSRKNRQKTIENNFSALSAFYDYLIFQGYVSTNLILPFRRRYLRMYKKHNNESTRKLLSIKEVSRLVNSILDPRDKAINVLLAKTGVRRAELLNIDIQDINWSDYSILLKPTPKRSNRVVFFDDECALVLRRWLRVREQLNPATMALFVSYQTLTRISRNAAYQAVVKYAKRLGFHDSDSFRLEDHFGPHCFRHWFTTHLLRGGMKREYVKELRGDRRKEAIDIYHHIDKENLRRAYLTCIPKIGI